MALLCLGLLLQQIAGDHLGNTGQGCDLRNSPLSLGPAFKGKDACHLGAIHNGELYGRNRNSFHLCNIFFIILMSVPAILKDIIFHMAVILLHHIPVYLAGLFHHRPVIAIVFPGPSCRYENIVASFISFQEDAPIHAKVQTYLFKDLFNGVIKIFFRINALKGKIKQILVDIQVILPCQSLILFLMRQLPACLPQRGVIILFPVKETVFALSLLFGPVKRKICAVIQLLIASAVFRADRNAYADAATVPFPLFRKSGKPDHQFI